MSPEQMKRDMVAMEKYNAALRKAGVLKDCDGLRLNREGKRVRFDGVKRCPNPMPVPSEIEIRPI